MTGVEARRQNSLGQRALVAIAVYTLGVAVVGVALMAVQQSFGERTRAAMSSFVEEQTIADQITTGMMQQLVAATAYQRTPDERLQAEFMDAGERVQAAILQYLFRDLAPDERLQLELVKEQHQRLEVAAARSLELATRGRTGEAAAASRAMVDHGLALQAATNDFLALRKRDLDRFSQEQATGLRRLYLAGGGVALLLVLSSLFWGVYLYRRLARPLEEMTDAATRIGQGNLDVRVPLPADRELASLAGSFNRMSDRLSDARAALERRNQELEGALSRLRETQAELVQTEKLSAMGRMMAGLAHELNNPLASVLGYAQLLEEDLRPEYVQPLVAEAGRARDLVQNLLRFTRKSDARIRPVPLQEALDVVSGLRSYAFAQAGLELRIEPAEGVWVRADPQRLQQALLNVVNNSYQALLDRGGPGHVHVGVRTEEGRVHTVVDDDGPGFSDATRVFEPFYTTKPVGEGTGLGLTIVHRFIAEAGGRVSAANLPGGGARVVLSLAAAEPTVTRAADTAPSPEPPAPARLRILLVEDEQPLRALQERLLRRNGWDVVAVAGGREARKVLEKTDFDLVISDVKMPDGSGLELFRWIERERPALVEQFLFVTGEMGDPELEELAARRPEMFVSKPFDKREYLARIAARFAEAEPASGAD